ncbi:MAG TPA: DNA/RNA nuclease SfsA [Hyphomicrobiaceae bacterium]|nr:DNA/RNA nuclease SfsA [Hyphomicrobiaceae bacterium]
MKFASPLVRGTLVQRYKRFLADVRLDDGTVVTATCPNTGSMIGLREPGQTVWLSTSDSPTRKYRHTWEMVEHDQGKGGRLVGINTSHPNKLVEEAIRAGKMPKLDGYAELKREQKYGRNSRIDILLSDPGKGLCYVEIKNVHLSRSPAVAEFPDSVTERGAKHLDELADMVREGHRAVMVFLIQRSDTKRFVLAPDIDPGYVAAFDRAATAGVEMMAVRCKLSESGISVDKPVPVERAV